MSSVSNVGSNNPSTPSRATGDISNALGKLESSLSKDPFKANLPGGSVLGVVNAMGNG
jgi:hypothetical protein